MHVNLLFFVHILSNVKKTDSQPHQLIKTQTDAYGHLEKPFEAKNICTRMDQEKKKAPSKGSAPLHAAEFIHIQSHLKPAFH